MSDFWYNLSSVPVTNSIICVRSILPHCTDSSLDVFSNASRQARLASGCWHYGDKNNNCLCSFLIWFQSPWFDNDRRLLKQLSKWFFCRGYGQTQSHDNITCTDQTLQNQYKRVASSKRATYTLSQMNSLINHSHIPLFITSAIQCVKHWLRLLKQPNTMYSKEAYSLNVVYFTWARWVICHMSYSH